MTSRRTFLGMLGLAPAAASAGARQAMTLAGINPDGAILGSVSSGVTTDTGGAGPAVGGYVEKAKNWLGYLRVFGVPDFVKEDLRRNAKGVYRLDPDLAANRSFSLSAKMRIQIEREYLDAIRETERRAKSSVARRLFEKAHGFEVW